MTIEQLTSLIGTLGFPVAMCIAMAWYVKYITDDNNVRMDELRKENSEKMEAVTTALNSLTLAVTELKNFFEREVDKK